MTPHNSVSEEPVFSITPWQRAPWEWCGQLLCAAQLTCFLGRGRQKQSWKYHLFPSSFSQQPYLKGQSILYHLPTHSKPNLAEPRGAEWWALGQQSQLPYVSSCCGVGRSWTFKVSSETNTGNLNLFAVLLIP